MKGYFAILDTKAGVFTQPFLEWNDLSAIRMFGDLCMDPKTVFSRYPADYQLFHVGEWDELEGKLSGSAPRSITNGAQVVVKEA